jgi:hypothetical protein
MINKYFFMGEKAVCINVEANGLTNNVYLWRNYMLYAIKMQVGAGFHKTTKK